MSDKLKPCPFCGGEACIEDISEPDGYERDIGPGYWNDKLMVIGNCLDNPELLGSADDEH